MARKTPQELETSILEALPASGGITYESFDAGLDPADKPALVAQVKAMKRAGTVKTYFEKDANGNSVHMIGRA